MIEDAEVVGDVTVASGRAAELTFPRLHARTQRFTLGEPRNVEVSASGTSILFLRSSHGHDPVNAFGRSTRPPVSERLLADPAELIVDDSASPAARRARPP